MFSLYEVANVSWDLMDVQGAEFVNACLCTSWWLVWRSGNGVCHINNEVTLRRTRLVLGLVTTFGGSTIPVFIHATQSHSAWPSFRG